MYAKARRGEIKDFTGIDDPYEPPASPEIILDTVSATPEVNARRIVDYLISNGFIRSFDLTDQLPISPMPVTISEMAAGRRAR
jgi:hypothetical protein